MDKCNYCPNLEKRCANGLACATCTKVEPDKDQWYKHIIGMWTRGITKTPSWCPLKEETT